MFAIIFGDCIIKVKIPTFMSRINFMQNIENFDFFSNSDYIKITTYSKEMHSNHFCNICK